MSTQTLPHPKRAPRFVRAPGPIVRRLLAKGLPFGPNVLITIRGRRSGTPHTFPIALTRFGDRRFVQSPFGDVNWVHNLRAAGEATITKGDRREDVHARELTPEEAGPVLRGVLSPYLRNRILGVFTRRYFAISPDSTDAQFVDKARRQPIFELTTKR
jgi:deazaflavin-dependent oxidoreductase (nitroreductase family)